MAGVCDKGSEHKGNCATRDESKPERFDLGMSDFDILVMSLVLNYVLKSNTYKSYKCTSIYILRKDLEMNDTTI